MKQTDTDMRRWTIVATYAIAMAWVESAVVFYLRTMIDRIDPYQADPLVPVLHGMGKAELIRELSTIVMLATVGMLAGKNFKSRAGFFVVAFGIWDIFYYVFLKVMTGWPNSLFDWDLLFLIPLPWWGPVWSPIAIALLMITWGTWASRSCDDVVIPVASRKAWALATVGAAIALYVFMTDAVQVCVVGGSLGKLLPATFDATLFIVGLVLMSMPLAEMFLTRRQRDERRVHRFDYEKWLVHFQRNRENRTEPNWAAPVSISPKMLSPLLRSLEQFQLGDGGGPLKLIAFDAKTFHGRNDETGALVEGWFKEEQEHARLLGCAVDRLGGERITRHWSFTAFCWVRRLFGVRFELQVLLLTELVSTAYYRVLRRHVPDEPIAAMCQLILRDEAGHVAFHRDRLAATNRDLNSFLGAFWEMQFWFFGHAAATVLWASHSQCLTAIGGSRSEYFSEVRYELARFGRSLSCENEPYTMLAVAGK